MKIIEDLGRIPISEGSKHMARFCIYECTECKTHFKANVSKVKSRRIELCPKCAKDGRHRKTHGMTGTRLHTLWINMRARCKNENNIHYGNRGIVVCPEWEQSFEVFRDWAYQNGYTDDLEIDRIDSNGNYEPENCRFVDNSTQSANRRQNQQRKDNGVYSGTYKHGNKYKLMLGYLSQPKYLGLFNTMEEAAEYRNNYIKENNLPHMLCEIIKKEDCATQETSI